MKQTFADKLRAAFRSEIEAFVAWIDKISSKPGGTGVREGVVDDPFWDAWNEWHGRIVGMERMLLAAGIRRASIEKDKEVLPEKVRATRPLKAA